ncbi:MAG: hypothetical protein IPL39_12805 [Opitutaceae bacterium]|nr:hypothetical protein [Opitutaceae bacterium]
MIDRKARNEAAQALRSYMNEETTAFQFDGALRHASGSTGDHTVQAVGRALWSHYDDCRDHKIVASKEAWDYFGRLLLLLESDAEIETTKSWRRWHPLQCVAAVLLLLFLVITFRADFSGHLLPYTLPFGPPSMLLAWLNSRSRRKAIAIKADALIPFSTVGGLLTVRRQVPNFIKRRYPKAINSRRIRGPIVDRLMWVPVSIAWFMFSPVALFFQMLPGREFKTIATLHGSELR